MNILVTMDFTDVSLNGFKYAFDRFQNDNITVIHVISGLLNVKSPFISKANITQDIIAIQRIEQSIFEHLGVQELPDNVQVEAYYGEPVSVISKYLKDHSFDAVVIGSRDKYDLLDKIFGTTSLGVVKKSDSPIFVIPRFANYKEYSKIMVACDETVSDTDILIDINFWNSSNAQVKFLHISKGSNDNFDETKKLLVKNLYEDYQPPFSYEIEEQHAKDITDTLLANAYNFGADLLIVIARKSSFLQTLIYKSTSKELIQKSSIPILFLHKKEQLANT